MFLTFALVHTSTADMPGPAEYPSSGLPDVDVYTLHTSCLLKASHFWQAPAEFDLFRQHAYGRSAQLFLKFVEGSRVSHPAHLITVAPTPWYSMFSESAECNSCWLVNGVLNGQAELLLQMLRCKCTHGLCQTSYNGAWANHCLPASHLEQHVFLSM